MQQAEHAILYVDRNYINIDHLQVTNGSQTVEVCLVEFVINFGDVSNTKQYRTVGGDIFVIMYSVKVWQHQQFEGLSFFMFLKEGKAAFI